MHAPTAGLSLLHPVSPVDRVHTYVSTSHLHGGIAVDIGQQAQAETFGVGRICESVHSEGRLRGVKGLPDPLVQLIVGYGAPERRLRVGHRLQVYNTQTHTHTIYTKCGTKSVVSQSPYTTNATL